MHIGFLCGCHDEASQNFFQPYRALDSHESAICSETMAKRTTLTMERKFEIINAVDRAGPHCKKQKIADEFGIPNSTLSTILKNRSVIQETFESGNTATSKKRLRKCSTDAVDQRLLTWMLGARASNLCITGAILQQKAQEIANELGLSDWVCSDAWISRWKTRHAISLKQVSGEGNSVDMTVVTDFQTNVLPKILQNYAPKDVFNADETALFWRAQPTKTLELKGKKCYGGKLSKERISVMVMANSDGTEKYPLLAIGKFANPRCFKNIRRKPISYDFNKKAWMTATIFTSWIRKFDAQMSYQKRNVILFLDNCSAHPHLTDLRSVRLYFLPANTTAKTQPCDAGIIRNLKLNYRKKLMSRMLTWHDAQKDMSEFSISLLDSLSMLKEAWDDVTADTVKNCFRHCGFSDSLPSSVMVTAETSEEFQCLAQRNLIGPDVDLDTLIDVDAEVCTHDLPFETSDVISSDDDEDDCGNHMVVATSAAENAIQLLKLYALQNDIEDNHLVHFEKLLSRHRMKKVLVKQSTLDGFFEKR